MDESANATGSHERLTVVGEFLLDRETIRVWRGNNALQLSLRQFRMMDVFMRHAGEPLSRKTLIELVWGSDSSIDEGTVNTEIVRLRQAIGSRKRQDPITTIRNVGFMFRVSGARMSTKER
jgi:two-component system, OmpR family, phosphate regulon response regulator PhoB